MCLDMLDFRRAIAYDDGVGVCGQPFVTFTSGNL